jgi:hypothetical protein
MTRETKIGLLVGLAFIIVIGILLSDHLTSATEPPQAPLAQAGNDVRRGVAFRRVDPAGDTGSNSAGGPHYCSRDDAGADAQASPRDGGAGWAGRWI